MLVGLTWKRSDRGSIALLGNVIVAVVKEQEAGAFYWIVEAFTGPGAESVVTTEMTRAEGEAKAEEILARGESISRLRRDLERAYACIREMQRLALLRANPSPVSPHSGETSPSPPPSGPEGAQSQGR